MVNTAGNYKYAWAKKFGQWKIVEKSTSYIVCLTSSQKKAIKIANWLNAGGGFNGVTPMFFIDRRYNDL